MYKCLTICVHGRKAERACRYESAYVSQNSASKIEICPSEMIIAAPPVNEFRFKFTFCISTNTNKCADDY